MSVHGLKIDGIDLSESTEIEVYSQANRLADVTRSDDETRRSRKVQSHAIIAARITAAPPVKAFRILEAQRRMDPRSTYCAEVSVNGGVNAEGETETTRMEGVVEPEAAFFPSDPTKGDLVVLYCKAIRTVGSE